MSVHLFGSSSSSSWNKDAGLLHKSRHDMNAHQTKEEYRHQPEVVKEPKLHHHYHDRHPTVNSQRVRDKLRGVRKSGAGVANWGAWNDELDQIESTSSALTQVKNVDELIEKEQRPDAIIASAVEPSQAFNAPKVVIGGQLQGGEEAKLEVEQTEHHWQEDDDDYFDEEEDQHHDEEDASGQVFDVRDWPTPGEAKAIVEGEWDDYYEEAEEGSGDDNNNEQQKEEQKQMQFQDNEHQQQQAVEQHAPAMHSTQPAVNQQKLEKSQKTTQVQYSKPAPMQEQHHLPTLTVGPVPASSPIDSHLSIQTPPSFSPGTPLSPRHTREALSPSFETANASSSSSSSLSSSSLASS